MENFYYEEIQGQSVPEWVCSDGVFIDKMPWGKEVVLFLESINVKHENLISWELYNRYLEEHSRSHKNKRIITIGKINVNKDACYNDLDKL